MSQINQTVEETSQITTVDSVQINKNLRDAIRQVPKVETFGIVSEYKHWKNVVTRIIKLYQIDEDSILDIVLINIAGEVAKKMGGHEFKTVQDFWSHMDETYGDNFDKEKYENYYIMCHPPTSVVTMTEYINHFEEYLGRLRGVFEGEQSKIFAFLSPLNPVIIDGISSQNPTSLEDAKKKAQTSTLMIPDQIFRPGHPRYYSKKTNNYNGNSNSNHNHNDKAVVVCHYCLEPGHIATHCRVRKANQPSASNGSNLS